VILLAEHFAGPPNWTWLILGYFFLAGLAGGCYALGAMLRLFGRRGRDDQAAHLAFLAAFPLVLICPILLTADLGQPARFWHMLIDSANLGLNFKYWSPMSMGVWGLSAFAAFAFVSFVGELYQPVRAILAGGLGRVVELIGLVLALFVAAYTGVLLSVSNQPVWSDGWPLGGLFLASGMSGAASLLVLWAWLRRREAGAAVLALVDRYFVAIEVLFLLVFLLTVAIAGTLAKLFGPVELVLWLLVVAGLAVPFLGTRARGLSPALASVLVLAGVLALRAAIIFGAQG
jgi:polysulfide reductase chain C